MPPPVPHDSTAAQDLAGSSLLAVFAHPDDESLACGGLLARCSAAGVSASLLCLTRGAQGPGSDGDGLGDTRALELVGAAKVLGLRDVVLLDHEDGMVPWIEPNRLEEDILSAIQRFTPEVVVTFDEDGLYWHPDHVAVHERTSAVVASLGPVAPVLLYVSMPPGAMRAVSDAVAGQPGMDEAILGVADVDAFGSHAPAPTLFLDVTEFAIQKLEALRCHRSQVQGGALAYIDERDAARLLGTEHFRQAGVGAKGCPLLDWLGSPIPAEERT